MPGSSKTLLTFRVGSLLFAVDESEIATVADWRQPTPLPHAPPAVMGIISLQGRMLTVLDLRRVKDPEGADNGIPNHLIAFRGDEQLALAVDAIENSIEATGISGEVEVMDVRALFSSAIQGRERRQRQF
ncbi:MAG TPA: chemotaxis protein CheW [Pyrinomonadaceae bacterium]|nr:chemotaxis protein CheW [Pyrinomonadaceae bacterium]